MKISDLLKVIGLSPDSDIPATEPDSSLNEQKIEQKSEQQVDVSRETKNDEQTKPQMPDTDGSIDNAEIEKLVNEISALKAVNQSLLSRTPAEKQPTFDDYMLAIAGYEISKGE